MRVWLAGFGDDVDAVPAIRVDDASAEINPGTETPFLVAISLDDGYETRSFTKTDSGRTYTHIHT